MIFDKSHDGSNTTMLDSPPADRGGRRTRLHVSWPSVALGAVLAIVAAVYWPVLDAGFVWDDFLTFQQRAWLYHGDAWKRYIFVGFNEWTHYFRPLVVGLFVLQVRLFDGAPEPMHAVTLGMHLVNVALVVVLARSLLPTDWKRRHYFALLAGLLYGLHPMLVESVTWIGCQFDQVQVMTALTGLLCSRHIGNVWLRAIFVATCFLLSAGAKESAASFPAIVFLFDWLTRSEQNLRPVPRAFSLFRRNWPVYAGLLLAGLVYLFLRRAMMGSTVAGLEPWMLVPNLARIDSIAYVYVKYWAVIAGVPTELNPLHPVGSVSFGTNPSLIILRLLGSLAILGCGMFALSRRFTATGVLVISATLYLLPVLGIIPVQFDNSIYHERYAIGAIALACVLLPRIVHEWMPTLRRTRPLKTVLTILPVLWLAWAIPNIRATIPLWSNNVALWEWALSGNPDNVDAMGNLVSAYIIAGEEDKAMSVVDKALEKDLECDYCYINGLMVEIHRGDLEKIETLIERIRESPEFLKNSGMRYDYFRSIGHLELRLGNPEAAIELLTSAIEIENHEPLAHLLLAEALVATGSHDQAQAAAASAVELAHPRDVRDTENRTMRILNGETVNAVPLIPSTQ